jgi:hypothetical protein
MRARAYQYAGAVMRKRELTAPEDRAHLPGATGGARRGLNMLSWREVDEAPVTALAIAPAAPKVKRVKAGAPVHMKLSRRAGSAP